LINLNFSTEFGIQLGFTVNNKINVMFKIDPIGKGYYRHTNSRPRTQN